MQSETQSSARRSRSAIALLPLGDGAVFLVVTLIGLSSHGENFTPSHVLRNVVPLTLCWFLVALVIDTYGKGGPVRLVANWLVGITAGVMVRTWWVGSPTGSRIWTFLIVTLVTNGVGLLIWRLAAARLLERRQAAP